jgi:hypothetical protein
MSVIVAANAIDAQHREHHQNQPPELRTKPGAGTDYFSLPVARLPRSCAKRRSGHVFQNR